MMSTPVVICLEGSHVLCLKAFWTFCQIELNLLTFLKAAEAAGLNGGEMHEDIVAALTTDEAEAFCVVKPLHYSCFHWCC